MPKGNLTVIRNSDGTVIGTGIPTMKSAKDLAVLDMKEMIGNKDSIKESYSVLIPKEVMLLDFKAAELNTITKKGKLKHEPTETKVEEPKVEKKEKKEKKEVKEDLITQAAKGGKKDQEDEDFS